MDDDLAAAAAEATMVFVFEIGAGIAVAANLYVCSAVLVRCCAQSAPGK